MIKLNPRVPFIFFPRFPPRTLPGSSATLFPSFDWYRPWEPIALSDTILLPALEFSQDEICMYVLSPRPPFTLTPYLRLPPFQVRTSPRHTLPTNPLLQTVFPTWYLSLCKAARSAWYHHNRQCVPRRCVVNSLCTISRDIRVRVFCAFLIFPRVVLRRMPVQHEISVFLLLVFCMYNHEL